MAGSKKVLVAGASGLVGYAAVRQFAARPGWEVVGVSRRVPPAVEGAELASLDLLDEDACRAAAASWGDVTHLVYAALQEKPGLFEGWLDEELIERNGTMLRNLFEPLSAAANLEHVSLLHGTKAYGIHHPDVDRERVHIPLREREPRVEHRNFYWVQEDYLREKQAGASWGLTVFRPNVIYGDATGVNMNPMLPIAAWAALQWEAGEPLHFPGRGTGRAIQEAVDADLVGSALAWAAESPHARGGTFNLTNGDVFQWRWAWPAIAEEMGMQPGEQRPVSLLEELPKRDAEWAALVEKHGLGAPKNLVDYCGYNSIVYADLVLSMPETPTPYLHSTIAARQAGFHDCIDTEDMFRKLIRRLRARRLLPQP